VGIVAIDLSKGRSRHQRRHRDPLNLSTAPVIAIDPGQTTGWSLMVVHPEALCMDGERVLDSIMTHHHGQVKSVYEDYTIEQGECMAVDDLWSLIKEWPEAAVVVESFVIRSNNRSNEFLSPVRITAALRDIMWKNSRKVFKQSPSDAKNVCSNERLKDWGLYDSYGGLEHARDADRHALLFLRKCKQYEAMRAEAWPHLFAEGGAYDRTLVEA